jgi:calcineurin-like phosphoesterase
LRKLGAECLTLGEYAFLKKDLVEGFDKLPYLVRPGNLSVYAPGNGSHIFHTNSANSHGIKIGVACILGQSGFNRLHGENPALHFPLVIESLKSETPIVIIDYHANATAEKRTLLALGAGLCTAIIGSHTRVQTADTEIKNGTAYITDAGRTGVVNSVNGFAVQPYTDEFLYGIPMWQKEAAGDTELQGVVLDVDEKSGNARAVTRVKLPISVI